MSLTFFDGVAGSGKTTTLLRVLQERIAAGGMREDQRVLALTFMHGSRRRLEGRLGGVRGLGHRFDCLTIDSFAWRLLRRWRSRAAEQWGWSDVKEGDFDGTCDRAADLMCMPDVRAWVACRYPITVVDEVQDCRSSRLNIVKQLALESECYVAGDEFQDLSDPPSAEAVEWARMSGIAETLDGVHRTRCAGLLAAAEALRHQQAVRNGTGLKVLTARNPDVGASFVARNLTWWWNGGNADIVILTPTGEPNSTFVRRVMRRLSARPFESKGQRFGPFTVPWENLDIDGAEAATEMLQSAAGPLIRADRVAALPASLLAHELRDWVDTQRRVLGRTEFSVSEIASTVERVRQRARAHYPSLSRSLRVMTIHQAKNREFESVVIIWPLEIPTGSDRRRRLLYNAITRAKERALVVVQDPSGEVIGKPPFAPGE